MEMNGLPMYSGSFDHLRHGIRSLENDCISNHTIQIINNHNKQWLNKLDNVNRSYGSSLAMRLATEKEMFSHSHRLPGLESSNISLQTLLGKDEIIEFADVLNGNLFLMILYHIHYYLFHFYHH
jgi:hypothetical protein